MSVIPRSQITANASVFCEYLEDRYKGKVHSVERRRETITDDLIVYLEFRIPDGDADELEMFRRINRVIEVVVEDAP